MLDLGTCYGLVQPGEEETVLIGRPKLDLQGFPRSKSRFGLPVPKSSYQLLIRQIGSVDPEDLGKPSSWRDSPVTSAYLLVGFQQRDKTLWLCAPAPHYGRLSFGLYRSQNIRNDILRICFSSSRSTDFCLSRFQIFFSFFPQNSLPRNRFLHKELKKKTKQV